MKNDFNLGPGETQKTCLTRVLCICKKIVVLKSLGSSKILLFLHFVFFTKIATQKFISVFTACLMLSIQLFEF